MTVIVFIYRTSYLSNIHYKSVIFFMIFSWTASRVLTLSLEVWSHALRTKR